MWLSLAFLSAALLGLYDVAKKGSNRNCGAYVKLSRMEC